MSDYIKKKIKQASDAISDKDKEMQKEIAKKKLRMNTKITSLGVRG